jgi:two-component sensor histidine kinase
MAIHELATNAVKHGALSARWTRDEAGGPLDIASEETGGPEVRAPADAGFGMKLLSGQLFHAPNRLEIVFRPAGLICRIRLADGAHV